MWHQIESEMTLPIPLEAVFGFFAEAENLERITPPELRFKILTPLPMELRAESLIDYQLQLFGVPFRWRTRIASWNPPEGFVDEQIRGPYRDWIHTHRFEPVPGGTRVRDQVRYRLPLPPVGELAYPLVRRHLVRIFEYRKSKIRQILENVGAEPGEV